jgi:hypothetical protein
MWQDEERRMLAALLNDQVPCSFHEEEDACMSYEEEEASLD